MSREQLVAATKVSLRHLEALESGRFERLPAAVFSKGFVRVIALHLGLDAERSTAAFRHVYAQWQEEKTRAESGETSSPRLRLSQPRRAVSSSTTVRALGIAILLAALTGGAAFLRTRASARRSTPSA
ncbi:MAG: helix-turn-helix domain-containing protein, partial [Thermoanaerobaculia bacterium]